MLRLVADKKSLERLDHMGPMQRPPFPRFHIPVSNFTQHCLRDNLAMSERRKDVFRTDGTGVYSVKPIEEMSATGTRTEGDSPQINLDHMK